MLPDNRRCGVGGGIGERSAVSGQQPAVDQGAGVWGQRLAVSGSGSDTNRHGNADREPDAAPDNAARPTDPLLYKERHIYLALFADAALQLRYGTANDARACTYGATVELLRSHAGANIADRRNGQFIRVVTDLEQIYNDHRRHVFRVCLRMTKNAADAEDLTQETFMMAYRNQDKYDSTRAGITTWLYLIAANRCQAWRRKQSVKVAAVSDSDEVLLTRPARTANLIDRISLRQALAKLKPDRREALIMHDVGGYGHDEIGRQVGSPTTTVWRTVLAARQQMRRQLCSN